MRPGALQGHRGLAALSAGERADYGSMVAVLAGYLPLALLPAQARGHLEQAYERFKSNGDLLGRCRSWCAIVDSLVFEWNNFKTARPLDRGNGRADGSRYLELPDAAVEAHVACGMFLCLMYRNPAHRDMAHWEQLGAALDPPRRRSPAAHESRQPSAPLRLWWLGDLARADLLIRTLRPQDGERSWPAH